MTLTSEILTEAPVCREYSYPAKPGYTQRLKQDSTAKFPSLPSDILKDHERYGNIARNVYLDLNLEGTEYFAVFAGNANAFHTRVDQFFNRYGIWNPDTKILTLHLGYMMSCKRVLDDYSAFTMRQYLKRFKNLILWSMDGFYEIYDFRHEFHHPLTHVIHCYTEHIPECLLWRLWRYRQLNRYKPVSTHFDYSIRKPYGYINNLSWLHSKGLNTVTVLRELKRLYVDPFKGRWIALKDTERLLLRQFPKDP